MQVTQRLTLAICLLSATLWGRELSAQGPPPGLYPPSGQARASMAPYPGNSMFDFEYDRHYHQDGLWHRIASNRGRRPLFNIDYLSSWTRKPKGYVGDSNALTYKDLILPILGQDPYDLGEGSGGGGGNNQQQSVVDQFRGVPAAGIPGFNYYDPVSLQGVMDSPSGSGIRLQMGYFDPDESGMIIEGFGQSADESFDARDSLGSGRGDQKDTLLLLLSPPDFLLNEIGTAGSQFGQQSGGNNDDTATPQDFILQNNLLNLRGLPLDDGSAFGVSSPYDLEFRLTSKSRTYGASVSFILAPTYRRRKFMIRPTVGVRYMRIQESMHFLGQDSGLSYDNLEDLDEPFNGDVKLHSPPNNFDEDRDGITDNAALVEQGGNQGGGGGGGNNDEYRFILYNDPTMYPMTSTLNNLSRTDLIGPEVGLRYDLGGAKFRLWGQTKVAVAANTERLRMSGNNIGMVTRQNNFLQPTPEDPQPNRFSDRDRHTHVSPIIEQSFFAEAPLFAKIPILRRSRILSEANFRFGYTFLFVGQVARPYGSVNWAGNPSEGLFPSIDTTRSSFWTSNFSYSISWSY
tara:strand:+ start:768 stop:2483 length:1716 start_codon:yes stop_codon:yes gene_type:complete